MRKYFFDYSFLVVFVLLSHISLSKNALRNSNASSSPWSVGLNISTFGPGIEFSKSISEKAVVSLGFSYLSYNYPLSKLDEELSGDARILVGGPALEVDYYFYKSLYIAGGITYNLTELDVDGEMAESVFIGDIEMYPNEVGHVSLNIVPEYRFSPYIGLGIGKVVPRNKNLSFSFEVGLVYHGNLQVGLETTGMLEPTDSIEQEQLIQENISPLTFWPVVAFRVALKLGGK